MRLPEERSGQARAEQRQQLHGARSTANRTTVDRCGLHRRRRRSGVPCIGPEGYWRGPGGHCSVRSMDVAQSEALLLSVRAFVSQTSRASLHALLNQKAGLLEALEGRTPSAEDHQRVQTRTAPGLEQLSPADVQLVLQLSDELALNEADAAQLLLAANLVRCVRAALAPLPPIPQTSVHPAPHSCKAQRSRRVSGCSSRLACITRCARTFESWRGGRRLSAPTTVAQQPPYRAERTARGVRGRAPCGGTRRRGGGGAAAT